MENVLPPKKNVAKVPFLSQAGLGNDCFYPRNRNTESVTHVSASALSDKTVRVKWSDLEGETAQLWGSG